LNLLYLWEGRKKKPLAGAKGGEGGIRTLGTLRYTRSPSARDKPDYATSPKTPSGANYIMFGFPFPHWKKRKLPIDL